MMVIDHFQEFNGDRFLKLDIPRYDEGKRKFTFSIGECKNFELKDFFSTDPKFAPLREDDADHKVFLDDVRIGEWNPDSPYCPGRTGPIYLHRAISNSSIFSEYHGLCKIPDIYDTYVKYLQTKTGKDLTTLENEIPGLNRFRETHEQLKKWDRHKSYCCDIIDFLNAHPEIPVTKVQVDKIINQIIKHT